MRLESETELKKIVSRVMSEDRELNIELEDDILSEDDLFEFRNRYDLVQMTYQMMVGAGPVRWNVLMKPVARSPRTVPHCEP